MTLTTPATTIETLEENMVFVEGGKFMMGSEENDDEKPIHEVKLGNFYMARYPVTQAMWKAIMGSGPEKFAFRHPMRPVENVSWDDCQVFISKLNALTGNTYRLPTEAEWEYAARGGKYSKGFTYAGSNNLFEVGWYGGNSQNITQPVGLKRPNELGLFDMSGNVWEWCQDWYGSYSSSDISDPQGPEKGTDRVFRGGSWFSDAEFCRVSYRSLYAPFFRNSFLGFRPVRTL